MAMVLNRREMIAGAAAGMLPVRAVLAQEAASRTLRAVKASSKLLDDGPETQHWRFEADGVLPVVRVRQGEPFKLTVLNSLDEEIWLHLYGMRAEAAMTTVLLPKGPDGQLELSITPPDAGTFWIGPLLNQSRHREMGLYAMLIVEEAMSPFEDVPLLLDDWKVDDAGVIAADFGDVEAAAGEGRLGNWYTVNGAVKPRLKLSADKPSRLRLLNACNTRTLNLRLRGVDAVVIALDGQPVKPMAFPTAGLQLVPGQRADIVPTTGESEFALLFDLFEDSVETAFFSVGGTTAALPDGFALAPNPWPAISANAEPRKITLVLQGGIKGGLKTAKAGDEILDLRGLLEKGLAWAINERAGLQAEPLFEAQPGEVLILAIENQTIFYQPLALAGHVWHQLAEDGQKVSGQFWRDTAVVAPKSMASFVFVTGTPGLWTLSSLVAERADAGLIGAFRITGGP
jgi:FtsP/CotA-like multicopper oxidase with cupredoxin domain